MAAGDANRCIRNAAYRWYFHSYNVTNGNPNTGDAANMDAEVSLDGAAYADVAGAETEVGNGGYYVDVTAAENTGSTVHLKAKTSTANMFEPWQQLEHEPAMDSGVAQAGAAASITLRAAASASNSYYVGSDVEIVRGTGAGQTRTITVYVGATKVATVLPAWTTAPDNTSVYKITTRTGVLTSGGYQRVDINTINSSTTADRLALFLNGLVMGTVDTGSVTPTTQSFAGDSSLSATNDYYKNRTLTFADINSSVTVRITAYNGTTKTFSVYPALPIAPTGGEGFFIWGLST